ncbi:MAG: HAD family hydrolase [Halioglobus sp.]
MILIFDLDDTLYPERTYVHSGFRAVAEYGELRFGWNEGESLRFMLDIFKSKGRGKIFDLWLEAHGRNGRNLVAECVRTYRYHNPKIKLDTDAAKILPMLADKYPLYLVTDGHKIVQQKKIDALDIESLFRRVLITHRFGIRHSKPSTYCFDLVRRKEQCRWNEMVYVGDNPAKDFVNLKPLSVHTVRLLKGEYRSVVAKAGYEAAVTIDNLSMLPNCLPD